MSRTPSPDVFVIYKGDDIVAIGSDRECAAQLNTNVGVIRTQASPKRVARADVTPDSQQIVAVRVRPEELV